MAASDEHRFEQHRFEQHRFEQHSYDEASRERRVDEPAKQPGRTPFARDRARVVHSSALRRLAAKTQVVGPDSDDFVRNRLTHSLEVAQIGRELGAVLGCDPDLVETACLAHDLGHPPFGHNGEVALDARCEAIGGFEGNAQTLRLLTRLEAKTVDPSGASAGLNLTRASLDAVCKYPWLRADAPGTAKFNAYDDDAAIFTWLRSGAPVAQGCLEAQVMDWADDVAYSVHDVEDGIVAAGIPLAALGDAQEQAPLLEVVRVSYADGAPPEDIAAALDRLLSLPFWPNSYDGTRRDLGVLKDLTSQLVGRFCGAVERATHQVHGRRPLGRYAASLVVPPEIRLEVAVLKGVAAHWVMRTDARVALLVDQRDLVTGLVDALLAAEGSLLSPVFRADWAQAPDDAARLRVVVDQVASLTDPSALALAQRLEVA